jgi:AbrB family looped-hinge helix DNA binding protein
VEIVEIDSSGRIYIPAEIRRRIKAKRFKLRLVEDGILLEPIDDVDVYYGKFGPARYSTVEEIERAVEDAAQVDLR